VISEILMKGAINIPITLTQTEENKIDTELGLVRTYYAIIF
jgi:hypothetical protein